ncbi:MAG: pyridoxal phosphate-dependent aminotransferase family protein [Anaerolineae bacterium]|nr:pyridoxal phosphate-dependent aminotransferase family protein [Anaerolineae bacterium]
MTILDQLVARRNQAEPRLIQRLSGRGGLVQQPIEGVAGPRIQVRGHCILNFASANYLGLNQHPHVIKAVAKAVSTWGTSLGIPRLFATDQLTAQLETAIANLVGQDKALVFPSTTHIALDLLPLLAGSNGVLLLDERAYPISVQGAAVAAQRGAHIYRFPHNDCHALTKMLQAFDATLDKVIICDGVYSSGGRPAALSEMARLARNFDAIIYVDDAHGLGILGQYPTAARPYGHGGGGTACHLAVAPGNIVYVASLSKAFGVPIAFVSGPAAFIAYLRATAATFSNSSPPALPMLAAALSALQTHTICGEKLRYDLLNRVRYLRSGLAKAGARLTPNQCFPIQTVRFATPRAAEITARKLRRKGIWTVLQFKPPDYPQGGVLRFILTAQHTEADIHRAITNFMACSV